MSACIFKVQAMQSPISQTPRGLRLLVALPNMAGHEGFSGKPAPSFESPYFVTFFGDYTDAVDLLTRFPAVLQTIKRMGFDDIRAV